MLHKRQHHCYRCGPARSEVVATGTDYQYGTTDEVFNWRSCARCGHHFIDPIPNERSLSIIYPNELGNYDNFDADPGLAFRIKSILDSKSLKAFTSKRKRARVLDVGCAAGRLLDIFSRQFTNYTVLHGIEISEAAAKVARKKGYNVFISTIEEAKLSDGFYDTIILQQVIEHVHDPMKVLAKLFKKLRSGGRLIIETPALHTWDHKIFKQGAWEGYHLPRHFNLWLESGMKEDLKKVGFDSVAIKYKLKPVHWTLSIQNILRITKKARWLDKRLHMNAKLPVEMFIFTLVDLLQRTTTGRTSDVQYIATKKASLPHWDT